jgi:hypothetical protein
MNMLKKLSIGLLTLMNSNVMAVPCKVGHYQMGPDYSGFSPATPFEVSAEAPKEIKLENGFSAKISVTSDVPGEGKVFLQLKDVTTRAMSRGKNNTEVHVELSHNSPESPDFWNGYYIKCSPEFVVPKP